jgi:hypothetical protein
VIAAVLVAAHGRTSGSQAGGGDGGQTGSPNPTSTLTSTATTGTETATSAAPTKPIDYTVLLSSDLDLDLGPPQSVGSAGGGAGHDIYVAAFMTGTIGVSSFASIALWPSKDTTPSVAAECKDLLTRLNLGPDYTFDHVRAGLSFCLRTNEQHDLFVRVTEVTAGGYLLLVRTWDQ